MGKEKGIRRGELSLRRSTIIILILYLGIGGLLFYSMYETFSHFGQVQEATEKYAEYQGWAAELEEGTEYLSNCARIYTVTFDPERVLLYYNELDITRRQEEAYEQLQERVRDARVLKHLESVKILSDALREREIYAMRLVAQAQGVPLSQYPAPLQEVMLRPEDRRLNRVQMLQRARDLVFDTEYENLFGQLQTRISLSVDHLLKGLQEQQLSGANEVRQLMRRERILVYAVILLILVAAVYVFRLVLFPLRRHIAQIEKEEMLEVQGVSEINFLARTYNKMLSQIQKSQRRLSFEASHDALTGLYNRKAYDEFLVEAGEDTVALLVMDVDRFKTFNDQYGHEIGDKVLRRVSTVLQHIFRAGDRICRIGGDEFAVIMMQMSVEQTELLRDRMARVMKELKKPLEDVPSITLSVGAAFSDAVKERMSLFRCADVALYKVKNQGGNGVMIYELDTREVRQ